MVYINRKDFNGIINHQTFYTETIFSLSWYISIYIMTDAFYYLTVIDKKRALVSLVRCKIDSQATQHSQK